MLLKTFFLCVLPLYTLANEKPLVNTPLGKVRGTHNKSYNGRTFSSFEGMPYAKPPVGKLRFERPVEVEPWNGIWEATTLTECVQMSLPSIQLPLVSEDCLYINVYVPREHPNKNDNLDVFVHIHGGAFMMGSGHGYVKPTFFMDRDVILVTFNYRVGVFGFLSTEDDVVPGNNGLKDQSLALKWVQKNIQTFGGNPNSVTITGLSAGGASVHFHYFSPLSKGLFHRGIAQSGVTLNPWAMQEGALKKAKTLAISLGCDETNTKDFVMCMKQRPAKAILEGTKLFYKYSMHPFAPFAPVVETQSKDAFLTEHPYKMLINGNINNVPLIISVVSEEGILAVAYSNQSLKQVNTDWEEGAPHLLDYDYTVVDSQKAVIADKIKQFYFGKEEISEENVQQFIKLFSDRHFVVGAEQAAKLQAKHGNIFFYLFAYREELCLDKILTGGNCTNYGVGHGDDALYLYDLYHPNTLSNKDEQMKEIFLDMYTSFAKTNKPEIPNVKWDPISDKFKFIHIKGPNQITLEIGKEISESNFWHSLPIEENEKSFSVKDEL